MGRLYLVATPIGNLQDISARALEVLRTAALIAAEDTRHTRKLLSFYDIHTEITSYYEYNKLSKLDLILEKLAAGDVALVSDAGTPGLNDPGYELVRATLDAGYEVSPIPGPSAPIAALVASGLPADAFLYLGYLPRKSSERLQKLESIRHLPYTLVCLEAPHRLLAALKDLLAILGPRPVAVAREMTKLHEEIFRGTLEEALAHYQNRPPRGEITLVIAGFKELQVRWPENRLEEQLHIALTEGAPLAKIASELAENSGWPRRQIYRRLLELKHKSI
jgi:16S rRNA (cytidine1402-2'-O)-methyltransferase